MEPMPINERRKIVQIGIKEKEKENHKRIATYCQVKLPVIPSLSRSRNERWRLGPDPSGGIVVFCWVRDGDDVMLLNIDSVVGLPDAVSAVGLLDSNDDSSAKNVLIALPLPPLTLPLAAVAILLTVGFLREWALASPIELCFGEQSRDDDILIAAFLPTCYCSEFSSFFFSNNCGRVYVVSLLSVYLIIDIFFSLIYSVPGSMMVPHLIYKFR